MKSKTPTQLLSIFLIFILLLGAQSISTTAQENIDKNQTLYVGGSGPNNYTSIQTAINEAQAQDTIYIYDGTYEEDLLIPKSITLEGESTQDVIITTPDLQNTVSVYIQSEYVTITTLTFKTNTIQIQDGQTTLQKIRLEHLHFTDYQAHISASNINDILIYNCSTDQTNTLCSFEFDFCQDIGFIQNALFSTQQATALSITNSAAIDIVGNTITISQEKATSAISLQDNSNVNIVGNTLTSPIGIQILDVTPLEVCNNNFIDSQQEISYSSFLQKGHFKNNYYGAARILPKIIWNKPLGLRIDWQPRSQPYDLPLITMKTNYGSMILELYSEEMPITSQNFMDLTKINFFDGIVFHRVIDDFVIQGGGFDEEGDYHESPFGEIPFESHPDIVHVDGAISMARTNDPDSATSQFFICDGRQQYLDDEYQMQNNDQHGYAAFGALVSGFDVLREIASVETERKHMMNDWPVEEVIITYARLAE